MGSPPWALDSKFASALEWKQNEDELDNLIGEWTTRHTPEEVMRLMQDNGVAAGIVANGEDLHHDHQLQHRSHFKWLQHPEMGEVPYDNPPFRLSRTPCEVQRHAPCLGEDTYFICTSILGLSDEDFVRLTGEEAFV
ncbi:CoA transferase [Chloroflexota bacterium]